MSDRIFTFVVAEDEERTRLYLARKVPEIDSYFQCAAEAADGEEALELVERYLPDVLITDIKMPLLSGIELIRKVRATNPDVRILIISGYSEFEYARAAIELEVEDYLIKPIDIEKLRGVLARIRIRLLAEVGQVDKEFGLDRVGIPEVELADAIEAYLKESYRQPYSLDRLAEAFRNKPAYLLRLYKRIKGTTPTQVVIQMRIEKAKRLLQGNRDIEIKQIAAAVGYNDPLYFSRLFRKETGVSPTVFRESLSQR